MREINQQINHIDYQISILLEKKKVLQKETEKDLPNALDLLMNTTKKRKRNIFEDPGFVEAKEIINKESESENLDKDSFQIDNKIMETLNDQEKLLFAKTKKGIPIPMS